MVTERSKTASVRDSKDNLFQVETEKVEMKLHADSAVTSGLLIQRLTDLYNNPVEATVREVVSNGIDATRRSKTREVWIQGPTALSPVFQVRDTGVGMSYDDLVNVYSKYGFSTKSDDLDQIGAYGLGAKAPLSYCSEFIVTSVKDGEMTTILVVKEELTNYIKVVSREKTDEPNGTTVTISVEEGDIQRFVAQIERYNSTPIDADDVDMYINGKLLTGGNFSLLTDKFLSYDDGTEKVYSRVWINNEAGDWISEGPLSNSEVYANLVIGNWTYRLNNDRPYYAQKPFFYIELKPGIVSFNSSRDTVLSNERSRKLTDLLMSYIEKDFKEDLVNLVNNSDVSIFTEFVLNYFRMYSRFIVAGDNEIVELDQSHSSFPYKRLVHEETGLRYDYLLKKDLPKDKDTFAFQERREDPNRQTSPTFGVYQRNNKYEYHSIGSRRSQFEVTSVASARKEILEDKADFESDLSSLLFSVFYGQTYLFRTERSLRGQFVFITDADKEDVARSLSTKRSIARCLLEEPDSFISVQYFITEHTIKDVQDLVGPYSDLIDAYVITSEDLKDKLKKKRVKRRKPSPKKSSDKLTFNLMKANFNSNQFENTKTSSVDASKNNLFLLNNGGNYLNILELSMYYEGHKKTTRDKDIDVYVVNVPPTVPLLKTIDVLGMIYALPNSKGTSSKKYNDVVKTDLDPELSLTGDFSKVHLLSLLAYLVKSINMSYNIEGFKRFIDNSDYLTDARKKKLLNGLDLIMKITIDFQEIIRSYSNRQLIESDHYDSYLKRITKRKRRFLRDIMDIYEALSGHSYFASYKKLNVETGDVDVYNVVSFAYLKSVVDSIRLKESFMPNKEELLNSPTGELALAELEIVFDTLERVINNIDLINFIEEEEID